MAKTAENLIEELRFEVELILCCARTRINPDGEKRISRLLEKSIDWDYLMSAAFHHGILPLLSRHLSQPSVTPVPDTVRKQLRDASNAIARLNLMLSGELLALTNRLHDRGIRALPFKGPVLAATAYGNLSFRQFCDLDILVHKTDMLKAKEVLMERGFEPVLELSAAEEQVYLDTHHDYKFTRRRDGIAVEIQWGVTQWSFTFPLDFEDLWARHDEFVLAGEKVRTLSPDDLLLVLCVHGAKHHWDGLKWISDVAELAAAYREQIDWHRLIGWARDQGGERMLLLGLYLAHELLDADLPEDILKRIRVDVQIKSLAGQVIKRLFPDPAENETLGDERPIFYWRCRERLRDKLAIGWRYSPEYFRRMFVPNSKDHAALQLSPYLSFGYYFVRPIRLMKQRIYNFLRHRESSRNGNR